MKFMSLIFFSLFICMSSALAGGHIGSGGNGCWISNGNTIEWRTLEELAYPELVKKTSLEFKKPRVPLRSYDVLTTVNLSKLTNTTVAFRQLERLRFSSPRVYEALKDLTKLFNFSYVVQGNIDGMFEGDRSQVMRKCISVSPALITNENGSILFFSYTWNKIDSFSAEIILVHETFRLAQIFHPAFSNFTNSDLQLVTALIFSERKHDAKIRQILAPYEKGIKTGCQVDINESFKSRIQNNICRKGNIDLINTWRSSEGNYRSSVEEDIRDKFMLGSEVSRSSSIYNPLL